MATIMIDLEFETADPSLEAAADRYAAIAEWCSTMTRRLAVFSGVVPQDLPEPAPFSLPPILAG